MADWRKVQGREYSLAWNRNQHAMQPQSCGGYIRIKRHVFVTYYVATTIKYNNDDDEKKRERKKIIII